MFKSLTFLAILLYFFCLILLNNIYGFILCLLLTQFVFSFSKRKFISNHFLLFLKNNKLLSALYILSLTLVIFTFNLFRVQSNIEYLFENDGDLVIETLDGFKSLEKIKQEIESELLFKNKNVEIRSISFKRNNESFVHKIKSFMSPNKVVIFEFNSSNKYSLTADTDNKLVPINCFQALNKQGSNFSLNTSFYGRNAIGEIIIENKKFGSRNTFASGFFKVIEGKPVVGAKSIFNQYMGDISHSCQAYPSVMKNGALFDYIKTENPPYRSNWKKKTYRNLIGTLKNGNLVCVLSNTGGLLSVKEISMIAFKYGVVNATLFDGGAALQYQYESNDFKLSFSALNNNFDFGEVIDEIFFTKANTHFPAKSPVFLTVKHIKEE